MKIGLLEKDDQDHPLVRLNLSDFKGRSEAKFAPEVLKDPNELRFLLDEAWGDLLQDRAENLLKGLAADRAEEGASDS